mmetsp:Transcript_16495/g.35952  ORF Transcript_16495/g.35952 Transcript_16495/m.35952 type:complete len:227 (+) Transcript_16495:413-1093(+)
MLTLKIYLKSGVEVGWLSAEGIDDVRLAVEFLVNHESKDSHHGCSSVIQFNGTFLHLFLGGSLPREHSVSEITGVFAGTVVLHDEQLEESNESENLNKSGVGNVGESGDTGFDRGKGGSGVINVSGNTGAKGCVDVTENGKHGNASVLDLDVTKTVESGLVNSVQHVQRVPESQRFLSSEFGIESGKSGRCSGCLLRSKGNGGADKKGKDSSSLHCIILYSILLEC